MVSMIITAIMIILALAITADSRRVLGYTRQEWESWMSAPDAGGPWNNARWAEWCAAQGGIHSAVEWLHYFNDLSWSSSEWTTYWLDPENW